MENTYVYALDLALNSTGICIFTNDGQFVKSMTIDTHNEDNTPLKLYLIGKEFKKLIKKYKPSIIVIEKGFTRYNKSTQAVFRVHGLTNYIFYKYEQVYYPASFVKKVITGKGNASKEVVRDYIFKKYPKVKLNNLDESDAFAVGETHFIEKGIKNAS